MPVHSLSGQAQPAEYSNASRSSDKERLAEQIDPNTNIIYYLGGFALLILLQQNSHRKVEESHG